MSDRYRIFDIDLNCEFSLPELPLVEQENGTPGQPAMAKSARPGMAVAVTIGKGDISQFEGQGFHRSFEWCNYDGSVACWCERLAGGDEYLYTFPDCATYHISAHGLIRCFPHQAATRRMLRHLLLNQIIPRYLATMGRLVLHASAVTLEDGRSFAFLGSSGFGKSTLASSFHLHGARLISDDCILLDHGADGVTAIGGQVGVRLFPDSVEAVFNEATGFTHYTPYTDKQQLCLKQEVAGAYPQPCILDALFLLNDPGLPVDEVEVAPVSGSEMMMAMIHGAFSLDPSDPGTTVSNFRNIGQTVSTHLAGYRLNYPRVHERLEEVRLAVTGT